MGGRIKADVLQALADWKAGKPVRSVELGHIHRMVEHPGVSPSVDMSKHIRRDQERAHAYCFHLIESFFTNGAPEDHETFLADCDEYEKRFRETNEGEGLTAEELDGAEGLAWKALIVGWKRAIDGHTEANYIEVRQPKLEKARTAG